MPSSFIDFRSSCPNFMLQPAKHNISSSPIFSSNLWVNVKIYIAYGCLSNTWFNIISWWPTWISIQYSECAWQFLLYSENKSEFVMASQSCNYITAVIIQHMLLHNLWYLFYKWNHYKISVHSSKWLSWYSHAYVVLQVK